MTKKNLNSWFGTYRLLRIRLVSLSGSDCDTLTCVKSVNPFEGRDGYTGIGIFVDWNVTLSETYFVHIRGINSTGVFGVSIETLRVPVNDVCAAAAAISLEDGIFLGNTENATEDFIVGAPCGEEAYTSPRGVWYKITGNEKFLRATVCTGWGSSADSVISVYTGDCSGLICAAESSYVNCGSLGGRFVSWESLDGVEYYLFVHSPYASGSFELQIEDFDLASNSQCTNAEGPLIPANQTIIASTLNSISDGVSGCASGLNNSAGLWYSVIGKEGLTFHVNTCSEETTFDTEISIYRGSCDDKLECVGGNAYACGSSSSIHWKTEEGVSYFIKVHGYYGPVGEFGMTLSSFATPKNDDCLGSIVLSSSNETVVVSTVGSTKDDIPVCSYAFLDTPGTWYQMEGKGTAVSLSTCSSLTKVSSAIFVFSGSCENLVCVSEGITDYLCQDSVASSAIFMAEEGIIYYILLQSTDVIGGDVGLTIMEIEGVVENDFCQRASNIEIDGGEVTGTTVGAWGGSPSNECYVDPSIPDVWYFFDGSDDVLEATACSSEFSYFSMVVLQGNCTDSYCITSVYTEVEACASVQFQSVIGETYRIIFQTSPDSGSGNFTLSLNSSSSSVQGPENDLCSNAQLIDPSRNATIVGSTADSIQDEDNCLGQSTSRDLWYQVVGNGNGILANLCSQETDFDSQLSVYSSTDGSCSSLEYVVTNDDSCGLASQVWWLAEEDTVYFIRVHGFASSFGNFALNVREQVDEFPGGERY
jgi:hypothetical protein